MEWYEFAKGIRCRDTDDKLVVTRVADCLERLLGMGSSKGTVPARVYSYQF